MRTKLKPVNEIIEELQRENSVIQAYKGYSTREQQKLEKHQKEYNVLAEKTKKTLDKYQIEISKALKKAKVLMQELKKRDYE